MTVDERRTERECCVEWSSGDGKVTLWKENLKGAWECVSDMTS